MNLDLSLKNSFFITGTDTDIGKTYVASLLYKSSIKYGCSYYKPIQSGGIKGAAPDVEFLCSFNNIPYNSQMEEFVFKAPLSPHLALECEKGSLDISIIKNKIISNDSIFNINLIEGAGGVYVPLIRGGVNYFDLVKSLNLSVILVTSTNVGTINHTMLTIEFLKSKNIKIFGLIFNNYTGEFYEDDNIQVIQNMSGISNSIIIPKGATNISNEDFIKFFKKLKEVPYEKKI